MGNDNMDAADHSEAGEAFDDVIGDASDEPQADRSHNRDTLSSEVMTEMLRDLQDAMLALDERLAAQESARGLATQDTSRLARGVVDMGDALTRRVRALEQGRQDPPSILVVRKPPAPIKPRTPPQHTLAWTAALVFVLAIVLGMFWLVSSESLDLASLTAAPQPVVTAPAPVPIPVAPPPVAVTTPIAPAPAAHTPAHTLAAVHRGPVARGAPHHTAPSSTPANPPIGFSHYGPSPSTLTPAPSAPTARPPA